MVRRVYRAIKVAGINLPVDRARTDRPGVSLCVCVYNDWRLIGSSSCERISNMFLRGGSMCTLGWPLVLCCISKLNIHFSLIDYLANQQVFLCDLRHIVVVAVSYCWFLCGMVWINHI